MAVVTTTKRLSLSPLREFVPFVVGGGGGLERRGSALSEYVVEHGRGVAALGLLAWGYAVYVFCTMPIHWQ